MFRGTNIACSRRSDSGERCEVKKEREKIKAREESPPLLFIAFFTPHRSPLSERLEQASTNMAAGNQQKHLFLSFPNYE